MDNTAGVRSQESGVKLAFCMGLNLDFVPPNYVICRKNRCDLQISI
ncbi:hypothetical protein [Dolichospermum sp. UHCC 0259]|nr:hypothetical protein [Dolichospermum sp. UHCC 0259]